jgi:regulator of protease activity HflC (stomatin/prohibitin superfamily)
MKNTLNKITQMKLSSIIPLSLGTIGLGILASGIYVVQEGEVAVIKTLGKITDVKSSGAHYRLPFITSKEKISIKQQVFDPEPMASGVKGKQTITVNTSVDWVITDPKLVVSQFTPESLESKLSRAQQEATKNATLNYTLDEIIGDKRGELSEVILKALIVAVELEELPINILNVTVEDVSPPAAIAEAIQRTTVAMQDAKTAEQLKAKATNEAQAKVIEAKGQAEANAVIARSLKEDGAKVVEIKALEVKAAAIDKWDGKLPATTGGVVPFLEIK